MTTKPFVKWAGGKRQILDKINEYIKDSLNGTSKGFTYIEPFLGGGAVFFDLKPKKAIINDLNEDLINAYKVIKSDKCAELIQELEKFNNEYKKEPDEFYYLVRAWDRKDNWPTAYSDVKRATRMIFLNRTCYNGLYRVNSKGQFNTPIGRYTNPTICDAENLAEIHDYLCNTTNNIDIMNGSYEYAIRQAKDGDIIYIDPPYDYEDDDGFTKYQMNGFTFENFEKLKEECDKAINKGAYVIISNNATKKVIELFQRDSKYKIYFDENYYNTLRNINCVGEKRKTGKEVIIWGMQSNIPQANSIEKVIKLAMADENILNDKDRAMKLLEVTSTRQVAYYFSALMFFGFITPDKKFSAKLKGINKNEQLIKKEMYNTLKDDPLFKHAYESFDGKSKIEKKQIEIYLKRKRKFFSAATLQRRASTIKKWIEWMYKIEKEI